MKKTVLKSGLAAFAAAECQRLNLTNFKKAACENEWFVGVSAKDIPQNQQELMAFWLTYIETG